MKYIKLLWMSLLSFIAMFILMYIMTDHLGNVYINLNQLYMAGLMTVPMIIIELFVMKSMYNNEKLNTLTAIASLTLGILFIVFIRKQAGIADKQFLRSMIPHHAAALLMCQQASITDPEIKKLCEEIKNSQQKEIDFMKSKLKTLS